MKFVLLFIRIHYMLSKTWRIYLLFRSSVAGRCSVKQVFLEISQNSQNTTGDCFWLLDFDLPLIKVVRFRIWVQNRVTIFDETNKSTSMIMMMMKMIVKFVLFFVNNSFPLKLGGNFLKSVKLKIKSVVFESWTLMNVHEPISWDLCHSF